MATRGFENITIADLERRRAGMVTVPRSKYRNVRCMAPDGQRFDSQRECNYYLELQHRQELGEVSGLRRQVRYWLMAPTPNRTSYVVVGFYIADFVYQDERGGTHVVDAKGYRTQTYKLKKKWLELQDGIVIEEV